MSTDRRIDVVASPHADIDSTPNYTKRRAVAIAVAAGLLLAGAATAKKFTGTESGPKNHSAETAIKGGHYESSVVVLGDGAHLRTSPKLIRNTETTKDNSAYIVPNGYDIVVDRPLKQEAADNSGDSWIRFYTRGTADMKLKPGVYFADLTELTREDKAFPWPSKDYVEHSEGGQASWNSEIEQFTNRNDDVVATAEQVRDSEIRPYLRGMGLGADI